MGLFDEPVGSRWLGSVRSRRPVRFPNRIWRIYARSRVCVGQVPSRAANASYEADAEELEARFSLPFLPAPLSDLPPLCAQLVSETSICAGFDRGLMALGQAARGFEPDR